MSGQGECGSGASVVPQSDAVATSSSKGGGRLSREAGGGGGGGGVGSGGGGGVGRAAALAERAEAAGEMTQARLWLHAQLD